MLNNTLGLWQRTVFQEASAIMNFLPKEALTKQLEGTSWSHKSTT